MPKLSPAIQRFVLAFTTGMFLACAAQVSSESGLADVAGVAGE